MNNLKQLKLNAIKTKLNKNYLQLFYSTSLLHTKQSFINVLHFDC